MPIKNKIILITYPDSLGKDLKELNHILNKYFKDYIYGVHILPFYPSSADRGFAPISYEKVDEKFGTWEDVEKIKNDFDLTFDFMINHISSKSSYFKNFIEKKDDSIYSSMFIDYDKFWPKNRPTNNDLKIIYKRKPRAPYVEFTFLNGKTGKIWCTFDQEQIDLDMKSSITKNFIKKTLISLAEKGVSVIRLDAFAYTVKKPGTSCFFIEPDIWKILKFVKKTLDPFKVKILPEVHEHYSYQLKLAKHGYWVYDFSLPMLVLHTLYTGTNQNLLKWFKICPQKQFTTLDTHDGIGVVDVYDLLSKSEIEETKNNLFSKGVNIKKEFNTIKFNNLDIYQINSTFYSALGNNDDAYILARAIQFFTPGIPQVYYVGLLAGENDIKLVNKTKFGRDINRHSYSIKEIEKSIQRDVVKRLLTLMKFRNKYPAFDGKINLKSTSKNDLLICWKKSKYKTILNADLKTKKFEIRYYDSDKKEYLRLDGV